MKAHPKFGTDGVRGKFGVDLDPEYAFALGISIARNLGTAHPFLIGRDTRTSGQVLSNALSDGIAKEGGKTNDLGILPTPGIAALASRDMSPACAITASHNPPEDNGIKVFAPGGTKIDAEMEKAIEATVTELYETGFDYQERHDATVQEGLAQSDYVSYLVDLIGKKSLEGMKVVLDCANGAAFSVAPSAFLYCGARVVAINTESDGININNACGATSLSHLVQVVLETKSDIGFAFDGDADRVIAVDNQGTIRDGDFLIALFANEMKENSILNNNSVAATSMSNGALKKYLSGIGITLVETQVGDKYVLEKMLENDYVLGGEQSGHIIRRDFSNWGDGTLNALLVARYLNNQITNGTYDSTSEALSLFVPMIQQHAKVKVANRENVVNNQQIEVAIKEEMQTLGDGSRIIIRPSGTEPVVRITVEGLDEDEVSKSVQALCEKVESVCG